MKLLFSLKYIYIYFEYTHNLNYDHDGQYYFITINNIHVNYIIGAVVNMLVASAVDRDSEPRLGLTKDYKIGISCSSAKHAALRSKLHSLMGSESGQYVRVERHVYPPTVVSVNYIQFCIIV